MAAYRPPGVGCEVLGVYGQEGEAMRWLRLMLCVLRGGPCWHYVGNSGSAAIWECCTCDRKRIIHEDS